jgi:hypothetical protein
VQLLLYGTEGCHLCEQAAELIDAILKAAPQLEVAVSHVDIATDDDLFARYGLLIPVIGLPSGEELRWPIDPQALYEALLREQRG